MVAPLPLGGRSKTRFWLGLGLGLGQGVGVRGRGRGRGRVEEREVGQQHLGEAHKAAHTRCICGAYAVHMRCTCGAHAHAHAVNPHPHPDPHPNPHQGRRRLAQGRVRQLQGPSAAAHHAHRCQRYAVGVGGGEPDHADAGQPASRRAPRHLQPRLGRRPARRACGRRVPQGHPPGRAQRRPAA